MQPLEAASPAGAASQAELILRELDALPTLPAAATRLLAITSADDADLREVVRLIETDPAMTAKVLSLCARASLGIAQPVTTVDRAVVLLGLEAVRAAVLSVQVVDWMRTVSSTGQERHAKRGRRKTDAPGSAPAAGAGGFDAPGFWRHSIAVACAAELICQDHQGLGVSSGDAFVAGLVHDLGKPALGLALPRAYARVVELAEQRQADLAECEREILGLDHHTAGKRLAERWGLPDTLADAIWLHGQPHELVPEAADKRLIGLVSVADALCRRLHLGWSGNHAPVRDLEALCATVELSPTRVEGVAERLAGALSERCNDLGLGREPGERVLLESVLAANRQLGRLNRVLDDRSRAAGRRERVLAAIEAFHAAPAEQGVHGALRAVVRSAVTMFGEGVYAAIYQSREGAPWTLLRFTPEGGSAGHDSAAAPAGPDGKPLSLAGAAGSQNSVGGSMALATWLLQRLGAAVDPGSLRLVALRAPGGARGPCAVLVHNRADTEAEHGRELSALVAAWASAIGAAGESERTRVLGEQLAQSNRALTLAQQKLAEAQSMARLGELTAGAAHEMNNPLTVISGRAQAMVARLVEGSDNRMAAEAIVAAANRLSDLITRLHLIAKPPAPKYAAVSLSDLLALVVRDAKDRVALGQARPVRAAVAPVKIVITAPVPPVRADRDLLHRALLEIVANALESGSRDPIELRVEPDEAGEHLHITIADTGCGLSERALRHAFDPFFSEKPAGRQSGLGLPTAKRLLDLQGARLTLASREGEGTSAVIELHDWRYRDAAAEAKAA